MLMVRQETRAAQEGREPPVAIVDTNRLPGLNETIAAAE
jgi:hypothetical protein